MIRFYSFSDNQNFLEKYRQFANQKNAIQSLLNSQLILSSRAGCAKINGVQCNLELSWSDNFPNTILIKENSILFPRKL
jgi:hypothetical protein